MKPYASYKPSGVPWLGEVPGHWEVNTIKRGYEITLGKMLQTEQKASSDVSAPYLRSANVQSERVDVSDVQTMWFSEHEVHQLALEPNDLVVCEGGDAGRSAIWYGEIDGCYFQNSVNRVRGAYNNTTFYLMRWLGVVRSCGYMDIVCNKATIAHLTKEKLANLPMLFPPPDEQQAIADYLDAETARIDTLIHEKDELIGLLREWRQSVIAEAVTKGLDKTANFQLHPDPWIGIHPAHWIPKKLKYLGVFRAGAGFPVELQGQTGNPLPFFKVKDIDGANENGIIRESDSTVTPEIALSLGAKVFPPDAIVFAKVGAALLLNRFRLLGKDSCIDNNMMGFMLHHEIANPRFMFWAMQRINFSEIVNPGTVPSLNEPLISNLSIAVPLPDEQQAIADYLDTETAKIDDLIAHTNDEITLLKELRAATIADAVLGRVDVRPATSQ